MRLGLLSDVHANLPALQAALRSLQDGGVDRVLVAGDLVGYGGQPNECVEALRSVDAACVCGNHDLFVVDRLPATRFPPLARRSAELTRRLLSADVRGYLSSLPERVQVDDVVMTHGSLDDVEEYVSTRSRAAELLSRLPSEAPGAATLVLGHTHRQLCIVAGLGQLSVHGRTALPRGLRLINPGSVGQSRQRERRPRARCAIYDSSAQQVEFRVLDYDVEASLEVLRYLGLPDLCLHAAPRLRWRVARLARTAADRVRLVRSRRA
jgi:predicted phosphodiesterase